MTDAFVRSRLSGPAKTTLSQPLRNRDISCRRGLGLLRCPLKRLVLEPLPVQGDFTARFALTPGHLLHIEREIDGAHDAVAEHFIGLLTHRISVDSDDLQQSIL